MDLWTTEDVDKVVERARSHSEEMLATHGELIPIAHILGCKNPATGKRQKYTAMMALIMPQGTKDAAAELLQRTCREVDASAIVTIMESWVRSIDDEVVAKLRKERGAPTDNKRFKKWLTTNYEDVRGDIEPKEAIIITAEHGRHPVVMWQMFFTRTPDGRPIPGNWDRSDVSDRIAGRFTHLLTGARGS